MKDFISGFLIGCIVTFSVVYTMFIILHDRQLNSVGIEKIVACSVNTPNCHSNWNEIVWIEK